MVGRVVDTAEVVLWGRRIGAVCWDAADQLAVFEYDPVFRHSGIELAPMTMPLGPRIYRFPDLRKSPFRGLPGLLADSLPDGFGNAIIDQWLIREGHDRTSFSPIERLCYIGNRGMGALEFRPAIRNTTRGSVPLDVGALVTLAQHVHDLRDGIKIRLTADKRGYAKPLDDILRVGTSAGGARATAVVAWNPETREMRSGQVVAPAGFEYWLLKFDGVEHREHGRHEPPGYGRIEYAYALMARAAGIVMTDCHLLHENGRSHFMAKRCDRTDSGDKIHRQSLSAMAHLDHRLAGAHSYEQAFAVMVQLGLSEQVFAEQFRRLAFNIIARNQEDHTNNIAYLMDKSGRWTLAPAFNVIWAYDPTDDRTNRHQMTVNGLRDNFTRDDLLGVAGRFHISRPADIIDTVQSAVARWPEFAGEAGVRTDIAGRIAATHRILE